MKTYKQTSLPGFFNKPLVEEKGQIALKLKNDDGDLNVWFQPEASRKFNPGLSVKNPKSIIGQ